MLVVFNKSSNKTVTIYMHNESDAMHIIVQLLL